MQCKANKITLRTIEIYVLFVVVVFFRFSFFGGGKDVERAQDGGVCVCGGGGGYI